MKPDEQTARVGRLDIRPGELTITDRAASSDWAEAAAQLAASARERERSRHAEDVLDPGESSNLASAAVLRLEWPAKPGERVSDHWSFGRVGHARSPTKPAAKVPWLDAIAASDDGTLLRVRFELDDEGVPRATRFEVVARADLTSRIRRQGQGWVVEEVEQALAWLPMQHIWGSAWFRDIRRPGRAGRPDLFYATCAARYVEALATDPHAPIRRLIDDGTAAGRLETASQWRAWLNRARERGLLTKAPVGRAGGELTSKARAELRRAQIKEGKQ